MKKLSKCVGILALAVMILGLSIAPDAIAGGLHFPEKSPAARKRQAQWRAKQTEKKMRAKKHLFSH